MQEVRVTDERLPAPDQLVEVLGTLASPHRLRVIAALGPGRRYVSELARELNISRPLLQMHLRRLQAAGLVDAELEISPDGKALNYYTLTPFTIRLTPGTIAACFDNDGAITKEKTDE